MQADAARNRVVLDWRETGVIMPDLHGPRRKGYGTQLIEQALPYDLDAETRLEFGRDGVHCSIAVPITSRPSER